ncbi:MAG: MATE family efflux transporter [Anaerovoracaceae bacterium]
MENNEITSDLAAEAAVPENKMGTMPIPKLLLTMSLPAICSMTLQAVYNIVDSFFVSRISEDAMAAVTLVFPVQMLIIAAGVGTGVGLNSLISRRLGAKRFADADSAAAHGFLLVLVNWAVFFLFGFFCSRPFYTWYADDNMGLVDMATSYGTIVLCFSCFIFMQTTCEKILQATGKMVIPMISNMIGCVINIILDPIMIFGLFGCPAMGVTGAAAATIIGQLVGMSIILVCFFKTKCDVHVSFRNFQFSLKTIKEIYTVALPGMIMQAIPSFVNMVLNMILIGFSVTAVSVLGVYFRLQSFIFMPTFGLTQGAMPIMGYNYGARNRKRLMSATGLTLMIAVVFMVLGLIVFQTCPQQLMAMFDAGEEMMAMGVSAMRLLSLCFIPAAVGITFSTYFQALGYGVYSLLMSLLRQVIFILPAAWFFSRIWGVNGVWASYPFAEIFGLLFAIFLFVRVYRKEIRTM